MPNALLQTTSPQYRCLFPDWSGPRPLQFFLLENLLEARQTSVFPTNIAGPDEDVNIYLAQLLTDFLGGAHSGDIQFGCQPLFYPPAKKLGRRRQADFYRNNADHRIIMLGLFDRGEIIRQQATHFGMDHQESVLRDLEVGRNCYQMAANLMDNRNLGPVAIVDIWKKLAENFDLYVQILSELATRRLGFGAKLSQDDLELLIADPTTKKPVPPGHTPEPMDRLLDLVLELRQSTCQSIENHEKRAEVIDLALHLKIDLQKLLPETG